MRLDDLLGSAQIAGDRRDDRADLPITGISDDSRSVLPGDLFIARPGPKQNGLTYAEDAVVKGAVAVVTQESIPAPLGVPIVRVDDVVAATADLAHAFYDHPTRSLKIAAVTGTNGKTTTAYLLRHILTRTGTRCGLIGTVETDDGVRCSEADMTTPGALELAKLFARMRENGCQAVAMETSSHALDQGRVRGIHFAAAGFTNLTGDHLDYHRTMDEYAAAKARLFAGLGPAAVAIVNGDDPWAARIVRDCRGWIVRFGMEGIEGSVGPGARPDYQAVHIHIDAAGTRFLLRTPGEPVPVEMALVGRHNIQNALTAACIAIHGYGLDPREVAIALRDAQGAPGRLQRVDNPAKPAVNILVDYAHTDDALENVLNALRPLTRGKLRVVFGCGGDRDRTKRPRMAAIARRLGDAVYVTSDNPRTEDPNKIIDDILSGLQTDERKAVVVEPDRRAAIFRAIHEAGDQDVVLIAGKGHEKYQIVGSTRHHFDDVEEAQNVLG